MTWFVQQPGHPGFNNTSIPHECPQPLLVEDKETTNNTNYSFDKTVETMYEGGTYYFSSAQDLSETTSVYGSSERFALAKLQHSAPTLLAYGGTYAMLMTFQLKVFYHLLFLWYWRTQDETQNESITRTLHSVISAAITKTIHGRPNNFSAK